MTAELYIQTGLRDGKTFLKKAYHTTPFKVANITEDKSQPTLHLMLISSSPGILDGDEYQIKIEVAEGNNLNLHTQSYQRLFNMKESASQSMEVYMDKQSSFHYLPHPSVPHKSSSFVAKNKIFLTEGCSLTWGEVLTCGRKLSGEEFKFSKYHNITEIFNNGRLVIKENLLLQPSIVDVHAMGQLEGYTHQATLVFINQQINIGRAIIAIHQSLTMEDDVCFGISALQVNGLIVRLLGHKAEQLHTILKELGQLLNTRFSDKQETITNTEEKPYAI